MKAEERLAALTKEASRYWEPPVEEVLDLAREAIALLRRVIDLHDEWANKPEGANHPDEGEVLGVIYEEVTAFLDGEVGEK